MCEEPLFCRFAQARQKPHGNLLIAGVLGSLDEKIELNRKKIAELEALAKAIYDYWFVQFDFPDKNGKPYKSSGGKMVWNEQLKREVPEGWVTRPLGEQIASVKTGLNPRDNFVFGGSIKYITVKNLRVDGTIDFSGCDHIDNNAYAKVHARSNISQGDILFASIAPLGRCHLIIEEPIGWDINESVFSIRPNYKETTSEYLFAFLRSPYFIAKAEQQATGSIFLGIRVAELMRMSVLKPSQVAIQAFTDFAMSVYGQIATLQHSVIEYTQLRDTLLPLLMNGQVEVG